MGDLIQALDLHRAGRLAEAVTVYEGLVAQNPDAQPVLNYGGLARFQKGDAEGAPRSLIAKFAAGRIAGGAVRGSSTTGTLVGADD